MWKTSLLLFCLLLGACGEESKAEKKSSPEDAMARGKRVYMVHCISCHNIDPAKEGPLGPAVKGSSQALLEAKIIRGTYPQGYKPKRTTAIMPMQPALKPNIPDLAAFLK